MPHTVFILGAGASKQAGAPLMAEFLDAAYDLWKLGRVAKVNNDFQKVFSAIAALQTVHSKSKLDLNNVEIVFSAFEMARVLRKFPNRSAEEIEGLIEAIKTVIVTTLEQTMVFQYGRNERALILPAEYVEFVKLLRHLREKASPPHQISILTFNYDICIEVACYLGGLPLEYQLDGSRDESKVPLLKLHGSLNWTQRKSDQSIVAWDIHSFLSALSSSAGWAMLSDNYTRVTLPIGSSLPSLTTKDPDLTGSAVLVAPTNSKTESQRTLSPVWAAAASALSEAENIFVIGYSMPITDSFFHYLYALGTVGNVPLKRFWLFIQIRREKFMNVSANCLALVRIHVTCGIKSGWMKQLE
jgi:hypothetical protein